MGYHSTYQESMGNPERFWKDAAEEIEWFKPFDRVLDDSKKPFYRWFSGGEMNTCHNALDYHVKSGRAKQTAIIYDSPVTGTVREISYGELLSLTARFAGVLSSHGVRIGDRVIIYMPMIPEAIVAMLACARIGAVHSVVFGGFAPLELAVRIDDAKPTVIVSASCGIEGKTIIEYKPLLDKALELAKHKVRQCVIYQRKETRAGMVSGRDFDWEEEMAAARAAPCVPVKATDPLYILYTSGTTGKPKGVVRDNGGHAVALKWTMKHIYDVGPGDVFWAASDIGWVVGHSYIVYAPLLSGCTSVLYEGKPVGTPDPGAFWRVISQHGVKALFTAPTAMRAIRREDPEGLYLRKYDLSRFKCLYLAGERLDTDTYYWAAGMLKRPVIDHWWQTETGWAIAANCMGLEPLPVKAGSPTKPTPGYRVEVLDEQGRPVMPDEQGAVAIRLPLPPGTLSTLWRKDKKFREAYLDVFPGYYFTGDGGYFDKDGYLYIMGRVDEVINVAGHRLSTGAMEEAVLRHADVAECAVVGVEDSFKGQLPLAFVVLKVGATGSNERVVKEVVQLVRDHIGPVAAFKQVLLVDRLPKTRSGKVLRRVIRSIADGKEYTVPPTIDDPGSLQEIEAAVKTLGYGGPIS